MTREVKNGKRITTALPDLMEGFERNTTIEDGQQGICGDAAGNGVTGDVILLSNYAGYPGYSLNCTG